MNRHDSLAFHLNRARELYEGLDAAYMAKLAEESLLRRAQQLVDVLGKEDGCSVRLDVGSEKIVASAINSNGSTLVSPGNCGSNTLKGALEKLCDYVLSKIREKMKSAEASRFHDDHSWVTWAEQRLAEIEAQYKSEVGS